MSGHHPYHLLLKTNVAQRVGVGEGGKGVSYIVSSWSGICITYYKKIKKHQQIRNTSSTFKTACNHSCFSDVSAWNNLNHIGNNDFEKTSWMIKEANLIQDVVDFKAIRVISSKTIQLFLHMVKRKITILVCIENKFLISSCRS